MIVSNAKFKTDNTARHDRFTTAIGNLCEELGEDANEIVASVLEDVDGFCEKVMRLDGRGSFLGRYDGRELELMVDNKRYYIYRID